MGGIITRITDDKDLPDITKIKARAVLKFLDRGTDNQLKKIAVIMQRFGFEMAEDADWSTHRLSWEEKVEMANELFDVYA